MKGRKLTLYLDTSVIVGYYDAEFEKETRHLFEDIIQGEFEVFYLSLTEGKLIKAPQRVRELLDTLPNNKRKIELTEEVVLLANCYIAENVIGKASREDYLHIALATVFRADIFASWNFKHIVNVKRIRGCDAINLKYGYSAIDIRSPKDLISYGKE
jgi:predicted nucleic acid-binding protein